MKLETAALVISTSALLFTVASFWWMNWRKGKLHVGTPRSYAATGSAEGKVIIELPLDFFNDGPTPIIVRNLRLVLPVNEATLNLRFEATVDKIGTDQGRTLATQFPVRGREALLLTCEFQRQTGGLVFEDRTYRLELQAKLDRCPKWKTLHRFPLVVTKGSLGSINTALRTCDNDPA